MSNLRLINETEITSSVSSVNVTDVFSADFDIYKITISNPNADTDSDVSLRLINSSGSVVSDSNYNFARLGMPAWTTFQEGRGTNSNRGQYVDGFGRSTEAENGGNVIWVFNPFSSSSYTFLLNQSNKKSPNGNIGNKSIYVLKQTASMTGINFFQETGNITGMNIRTYGLRVDS